VQAGAGRLGETQTQTQLLCHADASLVACRVVYCWRPVDASGLNLLNCLLGL
jgi:hypothetical protein